MDKTEAPRVLSEICRELLSYDEANYRHVLDTYFSSDAALSHPLLNVVGPANILKVFRVWTSLNAQEPTLEETPIFDGYTAVLKVNQHLRPRVLPFIHIKVPSVTTLTFFQADDGLLYISNQKDDWTLEGLIQSVPLVNWWYNHVVRKVLSGLFTQAGSFLASANHATSQLREN
ncbi:16082_t:CDS:2, partial [Acaulospora morrowiae]